ncbi:hypothetical protein POPTR_002G119250v4 [Populus trichocarpa]|uniref:Uncharacterized protein n=1 Tax=Populus trichocarpa TaxID=3694 RepID=A0ACC0TDJ0_POPTR|nr:hypothetical protein POPTR_002G119250v4 [Populus trichocarpa]
MFNCKFAIKYFVLFFLIPTELATTRTITTQDSFLQQICGCRSTKVTDLDMDAKKNYSPITRSLLLSHNLQPPYPPQAATSPQMLLPPSRA